MKKKEVWIDESIALKKLRDLEKELDSISIDDGKVIEKMRKIDVEIDRIIRLYASNLENFRE